MKSVPPQPVSATSGIGLLGLGIYLPERVMTNEEWTHRVETSEEWIVARTGIRRRRIAATSESTVDLAVAAARAALNDCSLGPGDVAEIIVATDTPEVSVPDTASFVQHRLGAREVPSYDLAGSGCAGFLQALDLARSRIVCGVGPVLVVGVELLSRMIDAHDRNTAVLFGDAAGAAIVARDAGAAEILGAVAGTDGSRGGILGIEVGGTRMPVTLELAQQGLHQHVTMNGREVFREAVRRMTEAAQQVLAKCGVAPADLALVVPHQANLRIIEAQSKMLRLPLEKFAINIQEYGNTGSASIPLALWEARRDGRIAPGDLVLLTSFGAGLHWAAVLLRF
ncbi:MAG TPA: beta-ketoacyl-ACP synthase 3 [Thermoanaerobaculia bacterium]|nr:beta-ketoacyl-ACP synthase 3 [Thermoanaerobaculia bacterium]